MTTSKPCGSGSKITRIKSMSKSETEKLKTALETVRNDLQDCIDQIDQLTDDLEENSED